MSAYIAPVLNNGVLNTTFNSSDFEGTYPDSFLPLSGGNIIGGLNVSGNVGVSGAIDANDLTVSGNVGVGTTNPDSALDISGGLVVREGASIGDTKHWVNSCLELRKPSGNAIGALR